VKTVTANDTTTAASLLFPCSAPFEKSLENYRNLKSENQNSRCPSISFKTSLIVFISYSLPLYQGKNVLF